jgi:hypothetical protein
MLTEPTQPLGFPRCVSLSIEFNQHAVYYLTVEQWEADRASYAPVPWLSAEERARAIAANSVWACQWYPSTPVGSCELVAASFETLMAAVNAAT